MRLVTIRVRDGIYSHGFIQQLPENMFLLHEAYVCGAMIILAVRCEAARFYRTPHCKLFDVNVHFGVRGPWTDLYHDQHVTLPS